MSEREIINPPELAPPRGFSHGIALSGGRLLVLAGQDASDDKGVISVPGNLAAQYEQVVRNLKAVVEAAGGTRGIPGATATARRNSSRLFRALLSGDGIV